MTSTEAVLDLTKCLMLMNAGNLTQITQAFFRSFCLVLFWYIMLYGRLQIFLMNPLNPRALLSLKNPLKCETFCFLLDFFFLMHLKRKSWSLQRELTETSNKQWISLKYRYKFFFGVFALIFSKQKGTNPSARLSQSL